MNKRINQVSELLREEINKIIIKDFESPKDTLISVAEVSVSSDLKNATAYLSIIPYTQLGSSLKTVKKFGNHIQRKLNKILFIKKVPKIHWEIDERDLRYKEIEEALKK